MSRPIPVTVICLLLMAGGVMAILHAFSGATAVHGTFHPAARALSCLFLFAAVSGVWSMERWGLWTTLIATSAFLAIDWAFDALHPAEAVLPLAAFCLLLWRKHFQ